MVFSHLVLSSFLANHPSFRKFVLIFYTIVISQNFFTLFRNFSVSVLHCDYRLECKNWYSFKKTQTVSDRRCYLKWIFRAKCAGVLEGIELQKVINRQMRRWPLVNSLKVVSFWSKIQNFKFRFIVPRILAHEIRQYFHFRPKMNKGKLVNQ